MKKILILVLGISLFSTLSISGQNSLSPVLKHGEIILIQGGQFGLNSHMELFNENGDLVKSENLHLNKENNINCKELPSGKYTLVVRSENIDYITPIEIKNNTNLTLTGDLMLN